MKKFFAIALLLGGISLVGNEAAAQAEMERQAITSGYHSGVVAGASGNALGEISGSLGQVFTTTIENGDGSIVLTQGFQQMAFRVCTGDVNGDNAVCTNDLLAILSLYGASNPTVIGGSPNGGAEDLNGDGMIGTADLLVLLAYYGELCN